MRGAAAGPWRLCLALLILTLPAPTQQSDAVAAGAARFRIYCSECHGRQGRGGRGPDLASGRWTHGGTDEDIARIIAKGLPGAGMPAFGDQWDQNDIRELVAFIRSLAAGAGTIQVTGNPESGRQIYWGKGACSGCHMIAGRGGRLGPDLTRMGAQRSLAGLKESIVNPSADIADGYQGVRATPRGGRVITGIKKNEDNFTIQIFDTGEKYHSFQKSDLASLEELRDSLMPRPQLSPAEVDDLVAYLDTLRGKP